MVKTKAEVSDVVLLNLNLNLNLELLFLQFSDLFFELGYGLLLFFDHFG